MSATINIFDSAFTSEHRKIKVEAGLKIEEVDSLDWKNCLIYVNGFEKDKDYKLKDEDFVTIRQFPSDSSIAQGAGWFFFPVTSAIHFFTSGSDEGTLLWVGNAIGDYLKDMFSQTPTDQNDVGQGEQIPTISGAKNRSGANSAIPLLIGESMYTPITLAQSYTTISGKDGEEQDFHALYCLGYNNIDLKSVSLGIYRLSDDEKNGTSGSLDCTNHDRRTVTQNCTMTFNAIPSPAKDNNIIKIPIKFANLDDYNIVSVNSLVSSDVSCKFSGTISFWAKDLDVSVTVSIDSVSISGNYLKIVAHQYHSNSSGNSGNSGSGSSSTNYGTVIETIETPVNGNSSNNSNSGIHGYYKFSGSATINVTLKEKYGRSHYPVNDSGTRKGYHQQLELQQGSDEVSLYPQKVVQENFGTELMHPEGVAPLYMQPFSAKYPQKIQLEVQFQNLVHFGDNGEQENNEVDLCVGYSLDGGNTYLPFEPFTNPSGSAIAVTDQGTITDQTLGGTFRKTRFRGKKNKAMRFVATKTFSFNDVFNIPEGTVKCKNNVIEFKIWRNTVDESVTDSKYQYKCFFSAIRTWCYDYKETLKQYEDSGTESLVIQRPIISKYRNMTARLGFKIRAGEELKGTIDELNVVMMSRARYCTVTENQYGEKTYTWSASNQTRPTNNPASLALMVLQHPMRGEYAYTDDQIDLDSFGEFYDWCEQTDSELLNSQGRKYTANGVISRQQKTIDLVNEILNCGHGKLVINENKYGVLFDKPDNLPVMVLNNQNVLEAKNTKNFNEEIDGYSCKFIDCINDYQEDTQIFVPKNVSDPSSPDYKTPDQYKLENISIPFVTDVKRAYRMAMYQLACRKLRPETWERKLGVDGNLVNVGSIVTVQDDTLLVGIGDGAQIVDLTTEEGDIVSIEVDYGFNVTDTTKTYGVTIQHSDALGGVKVRTYELASFTSTGIKTVLTFAEPIDSEALVKPAEGDIVAFGLYDRITTDAICLSKKSNNDGTFTLTLVPYQANLYDAEYGTVPEYETNVTSPKDAGVEVSEELPPVTLDQVGAVAEAVMNEGTSTPPSAPTDLVAIAEEIGIKLEWTPVEDDGLANTIKQYIVEMTTDGGTTWTALGTTFNSDYTYVFDRTTDKYPEASVPSGGRVQGEVYLSDYDFRIKAENIYGYFSEYATTTNGVDTSTYGTWKIPAISVIKEVVDRTVILTAVYTGTQQRKVYGNNQLNVWIKRNGNLDNEGGQSFNQILGITPDNTWYTPEFSESVQPSETTDTEKNYHHFENGVATTTAFVSNGYKISQTLPLIGQNPRLYKGSSYVCFAINATTVTEIPLNPNEGDVIYYNGTSTLTMIKGCYYIYEIVESVGRWTELTKKQTIVPTEYIYKIQMFNESCTTYPQNISQANDTYAQALCTNIADIVHSHEHYKELYVEKLSAISANIGMISQGGMGEFDPNRGNYWALSKLSPEDSGIIGGIEKGAFRVGGADQYFKVTPDPTNPDKFDIELRAGNITLTSQGDGTSFSQGTYIYDNSDSHKRLALTATGIIAQVEVLKGTAPNQYWEWENVAKVMTDAVGNLIITNVENFEDVRPIGTQVTGDIYHFNNVEHPEYEEVAEGDTPSNPQGIVCTGDVISTKNVNPILLADSSKYCIQGTVEKDISNFNGNIVFFSKADKIGCSGILISPTGIEDKASEYNALMRETVPEQSYTYGEYIGLSSSQISSGIFVNY